MLVNQYQIENPVKKFGEQENSALDLCEKTEKPKYINSLVKRYFDTKPDLKNLFKSMVIKDKIDN